MFLPFALLYRQLPLGLDTRRRSAEDLGNGLGGDLLPLLAAAAGRPDGQDECLAMGSRPRGMRA